jgi:anti-sigma B factor antagonist
MHIDIDVEQRDGYQVLTPHGEIDVATGPRLKESITETLVSGRTHVVVNLLDVDFLESTGLGALIGGRRRALAVKGSLSLVCRDPSMLRVFELTGLDRVFAIYESVEDATREPVAAG